MTDNEIIRALECCHKVKGYRHIPICQECPLNESRCAIELPKNALALINRQKAEIEQKRTFLSESLEEIKGLKLKAQIQEQEIKKFQNSGIRADWQTHCRKLKAEAVKEFAERLSEKAPSITEERFPILRYEIDNLVKEFTEGGNGET